MMMPLISFTACSDDDDDNSLIGTWVGTWTDDEYDGDYVNEETILFRSDGTGYWRYKTYFNGEETDESSTDFFTWVAYGDGIIKIIYEREYNPEEIYYYKLNGNTLTIWEEGSDPNDPLVCTRK